MADESGPNLLAALPGAAGDAMAGVAAAAEAEDKCERCHAPAEAAARGHAVCLSRSLASGVGARQLSAALHAALAGGHLDCVRVAAKQIKMVGPRQRFFDDANELAAALGLSPSTECVHALVAAVVSSDAGPAAQEFLATALRHAASGNCEANMLALLDATGAADPRVFAAALAHGSVECVAALIARGARRPPAALVLAAGASWRSEELVALLLARADARLEECDAAGFTPLLAAAAAGNMAAIDSLLAAGANPSASASLPWPWKGVGAPPYRDQGSRRLSAQSLALLEGHDECALRVLIAQACASGAPADASLVRAAGAGDLALLQSSLGAAGRHSRCAAVVVAAQRGRAEALRVLLESGTGADSCFDQGERSALVAAARAGHWDCVASLARAGARVTTDISGCSALMIAAQAGHEETVSLLLASTRAARASFDDAIDGRALMAAMIFGRPRIFAALLGDPTAGSVPLSMAPDRFDLCASLVQEMRKPRGVLDLLSIRSVDALERRALFELSHRERDRARSVSRALLWCVDACARRPGLQAALRALLLSPRLATHFSFNPQDVIAVAFAALREESQIAEPGAAAIREQLVGEWLSQASRRLNAAYLYALARTLVRLRWPALVGQLLASHEELRGVTWAPLLAQCCVNSCCSEALSRVLDSAVEPMPLASIVEMTTSAVRSHDAASLALLLARGIYVSLDPLLSAAAQCRESRVPALRLLLERGADPIPIAEEALPCAENARYLARAALARRLEPLMAPSVAAVESMGLGQRLRRALGGGPSASESFAAFRGSRFFDAALWRVVGRFVSNVPL